GHTDIAGRLLATAYGEDPVAEARPGQNPGGDDNGDDPPEKDDLELAAADGDAGREQLDDRVVCRIGVDAADDGVARDRASETDTRAAQDQQHPKRDDERRQAGLAPQPAVGA